MIAKSFEIKYASELMEYSLVSWVNTNVQKEVMGRGIGGNKYTSLRKKYNIFSSGVILPKYNYMFHIDTIKVFLLMQHVQENLQLKAGRLCNDTISGHKFKYISVYECGGKGIQSLFK